MKVQIVSDIHLEFDGIDLPVTDADVLIAAGDIGVGEKGQAWLKTLDRPVIYVAGNHEYWNHELDDLIDLISRHTEDSKVSYLENSMVTIDDTRFLGCTLWTDLNWSSYQIANEVMMTLNDYRFIRQNGKNITPSDIVERHLNSRSWLEEALNQPFQGNTVIVTHHAPLHRSWYHGNSSNLKYAYCNDMSDIMRKHNIDLWVHGHVHESSDYITEGVRVVCNPRGYANLNEVDSFNPLKTVCL